MSLVPNKATVSNAGDAAEPVAAKKSPSLDPCKREEALRHRQTFFNYPEPLLAEDLRPRKKPANSPALIGWQLEVSAHIVEQVPMVRSVIWKNAGFGSLRNIRFDIEDYEPLYLPQVVPRTNTSGASKVLRDDEEDERRLDGSTRSLSESSSSVVYEGADTVPVSPDTSRSAQPETRATPYTTRDYRALYLSGGLTPLDVARSLLSHTRENPTSKSLHYLAFSSSKEQLVLQAAQESTNRYQEKRSLGPLDGVPCVVKDEYDMDGYITNLGSRNDYTGVQRAGDDTIDSWVIRKLREAGVVIIGKSAMVEFGLDTPGNNPIYGTPRNPYNSTYYTGGSSSGTAYAVSVGLVPIGLGSDGGGSIRIPASWCGVFGIKPTHGRVSFAPGQNHAVTCASLGPIAMDVHDLALLLEVIAQPHPESDFPVAPPFSQLLVTPTPNKRRVLGVPQAWLAQADPQVQAQCTRLLDALVATYHYEITDLALPFLDEGQMAHALTMLTDGATLLPKTSNLTPANRILLAIGRTTPSTDYLLAQKLRKALMQHLSALWAENPGMLIVTPTTACAGWQIKSDTELKAGLSDGDTTIRSMEYVWMANFCGLPSITVPARFVEPLKRRKGLKAIDASETEKVPVGLMAMGEWCDEVGLLQFGLEAQKLEQDAWVKSHSWVDVVAEATAQAGTATT